MSDIVERLRTYHWPSAAGSRFLTDQMNEAADEIERLRFEFNLTRAQLAAAQATNVKLREAITLAVGSMPHEPAFSIADTLLKALATPPGDDSALKECLKAQRERCAKVCENTVVMAHVMGDECAHAIRALED